MRAFTIRSSDVARCPIRSLSVAHYRDDGTCHCQTKEGPMTWTVDNRWSPGGSGREAPAWPDALAAYSARWIDYGENYPADIVPDRQGFAYDDTLHRNFLIERLQTADGPTLAGRVTARDVTWHLIDDGRLQMFVRRCGGYFYVDAWIPR